MKYLYRISLLLFLTLLIACKKNVVQPDPVLTGKWTLTNERIISYTYNPNNTTIIDTFNFKTGFFAVAATNYRPQVTVTIKNFILFNADSTYFNVDSTFIAALTGPPAFALNYVRGKFKLTGTILTVADNLFLPVGLEYSGYDPANQYIGEPDLPYSTALVDVPNYGPNLQVGKLTPTNLTLHTDYTYSSPPGLIGTSYFLSNTNVDFRVVTDYYYTR